MEFDSVQLTNLINKAVSAAIEVTVRDYALALRKDPPNPFGSEVKNEPFIRTVLNYVSSADAVMPILNDWLRDTNDKEWLVVTPNEMCQASRTRTAFRSLLKTQTKSRRYFRKGELYSDIDGSGRWWRTSEYRIIDATAYPVSLYNGVKARKCLWCGREFVKTPINKKGMCPTCAQGPARHIIGEGSPTWEKHKENPTAAPAFKRRENYPCKELYIKLMEG